MAKGTGKNGPERAQDHVDSLVEYLDSKDGVALPRIGVELNKSAIARACSFDRQIFRTNPRCAELLRNVDEADRARFLDKLQQAEIVREAKAKSDSVTMALEEKLLRALAENASLRREQERWNRLNHLLSETGRIQVPPGDPA